MIKKRTETEIRENHNSLGRKVSYREKSIKYGKKAINLLLASAVAIPLHADTRRVVPTTTTSSGYFTHITQEINDPNFKSQKLEYIVEAKKVSGVYEVAYLVNGRTNTNSWYQIGLSFRDGEFRFVGQELNNQGRYSNPTLSEFPRKVHEGDQVRLRMEIRSGKVHVEGTDLNNNSTLAGDFMAHGSFFVGASADGRFTGVMMEIKAKDNGIVDAPPQTFYNLSEAHYKTTIDGGHFKRILEITDKEVDADQEYRKKSERSTIVPAHFRSTIVTYEDSGQFQVKIMHIPKFEGYIAPSDHELEVPSQNVPEYPPSPLRKQIAFEEP